MIPDVDEKLLNRAYEFLDAGAWHAIARLRAIRIFRIRWKSPVILTDMKMDSNDDCNSVAA